MLTPKERVTRRGEIGFLAFQIAFWAGVIYFVGPALQSGYHHEHLTPTFYVLLVFILFSCLAITICAWLLLLAMTEAEEVVRSADELQISYLHLGRRRVIARSIGLRKLPVRLFRFHVENNFEPAWLILLDRFRLLTIPRARAGSSF